MSIKLKLGTKNEIRKKKKSKAKLSSNELNPILEAMFCLKANNFLISSNNNIRHMKTHSFISIGKRFRAPFF